MYYLPNHGSCLRRTGMPGISPQSATTPNSDSPDRDNPLAPAATKQGSPFYAEPADSIAQPAVPRRLIKNAFSLQQRHSNPAVLQDHHISSVVSGMERIESGDPLNSTC